MEILLLAILIGLIPAIIAQGKGRSFLGWWIFGALLFIVALPMALIVDPLPGSAKANELRARANQAYGPAPHVVNGIGAADEIRKAKELLDSGVITADEFSRIKARLL